MSEPRTAAGRALLNIAAQRNVDGSCSWCRWGDNDHAAYCPTAEARAALGLPSDRVPPLAAYLAALDVERHEPIIVGHCDVGVSLGCECGWRQPDRPGDPSWSDPAAREYEKLRTPEGEG